MIPFSEASLKKEFGDDRVLIAAMGAIMKPSGDIRPLHDGTHGVNLNNHIRVNDRLENPGPDELLEVVSQAEELGESVFCMSADITAAHRRVLVRRRDWGLQACRCKSADRTV